VRRDVCAAGDEADNGQASAAGAASGDVWDASNELLAPPNSAYAALMAHRCEMARRMMRAYCASVVTCAAL
jgi:hypothetical protein